jgi:putative sigma-54 modulation protein
MNLSITARGYKVPERVKRYIAEKITRKKRMYEGVLDTEVVLSYEKQFQIAELKVKMYNKVIIATEKSDDIFKSIDSALDNVARQIKRHKEKRRDYKIRGAREKAMVA